MGNTSSGKQLRPEVMSDLADATRFSEQDIRQWYQTFMKDFPSGLLGIDQFKDVYVQHFPNGDATVFAEHVFRTFDKDLDHQLDFREFLTAVSITAHGDAEERLRWAFQMYDIDGSGYVNKEECEEVISAMNKGLGRTAAESSMWAQEIFQRVDLDRDGKISEQEFVVAARHEPSIMASLQEAGRRF